MIKSVVRSYHWPPDIVGGLFVDAEDYHGLLFWYNDIKEVDKELKK